MLDPNDIKESIHLYTERARAERVDSEAEHTSRAGASPLVKVSATARTVRRAHSEPITRAKRAPPRGGRGGKPPDSQELELLKGEAPLHLK